MGYVLINESILSSIGNILRSKLGVSSTFTPIEFINGINNIDTIWRDVAQLNIVNFNDSNITSINNFIFSNYHILETISIPNCSYIGSSAFYNCENLSSISIPNCEYIGSNAFYSCISLSYASIPNCSYISSGAFQGCSSLSYVELDLSKIMYIGDNALRF